VIWLLAQGHTVAEVARLTGFVRRWVEELVVRYNRFGPSSLGDRRWANGAKPRILGYRRGEVFLNASWAASSALGWRGRTDRRR
jgi:hypothetical protein